MRTGEFLLSKVIPYFVLGLFGLVLCLLAARFLFAVPFRGSLFILLTASFLYLLVALGVGLLISTLVKQQFVAAMLTLTVTFLPAFMISGFIFDLHSLPVAIRIISYIFPARYYVVTLQTVLLAGDVWPVVLPNMAMMAAMASLLFLLTRLATKKQLA
jgi:ABC-2 type transport system permease protein